MTFLEICQMVLREADQDPFLMNDVQVHSDMDEMHLKVVGWVRNAYKRLQNKQEHWKFHHSSGLFITTVSGTKDYSVANVRELLHDSVKANVQGETNQWGLAHITYKQWRDNFNIYQLGTGFPQYIIELPNGQFRIEPEPDRVFEIFANWYTTNSELVQSEDVPIWHKDFHDILVWMALQDYMDEYEAPELLGNRVRRELMDYRTQFNHRYLPEIEISAGFAI